VSVAIFERIIEFSSLFSKSLWKALFVSYGGPFVVAACIKILQDCLSFLQPQLLRLFLSFISAYQSARLSDTGAKLGPSPLEGFSIATAMFVAAILQSIILHQVRVPPDPFLSC
jgi:ATP-binding cassette subfamily C (CFTR/MRP) protein 1